MVSSSQASVNHRPTNLLRNIGLPVIYCSKTRGRQLSRKKVLSAKHMVSFSEHAKLEIYKAFQDRLTFLTRHMIVWIGWDS